MTEREAYIIANMMDRIGPVFVSKAVERFGSLLKAAGSSEAELTELAGIGPATASHFLKQFELIDVNAECSRAERLGVRIITLLDAEYPECLKSIYDPPLALYAKGTLKTRDREGIAIVGTRKASRYGLRSAERFAQQSSAAGLTVISGLALGIDTAAHRAAVESGGRSLAVLGSALDQLYPVENAPLATAISESGCVLSEFPFGRKPDRTTFPMRNRIVSGLARATVVIEADMKSGAMITATQAMEQGRSVYAVPGRIDTRESRGPHYLLKNGAGLAETLDDILGDFEVMHPVAPCGDERLNQRILSDLGSDEQRVVENLAGGELNVDDLCRASGLPASTLNVILLKLEMKRVIRMLPGKLVELVG